MDLMVRLAGLKLNKRLAVGRGPPLMTMFTDKDNDNSDDDDDDGLWPEVMA